MTNLHETDRPTLAEAIEWLRHLGDDSTFDAEHAAVVLDALTAMGGKAEPVGDLVALREANIRRQSVWCPDEVPDLSFRGNELGGEVGEALNVIKKLERERLGWRGSRDTVEHLAEELADVVICADLCAMSAGVDLAAAVVAKFNATSDKVGIDVKIALASPVQARTGEVTDEMVEAAAKALCVSRGSTPGTLFQFNVFTGDEPFDHEDSQGRRFTYAWRKQVEHARAALEAALSSNESNKQ